MDQPCRTAKLKDDTVVTIRPLTRQDAAALLSFFRSLPDIDRHFLDEDVTCEEVLDRSIEDQELGRVVHIVAEKDDAIVGDGTVHINKHGWQSHMAEIRCVVAEAYRRKGLGTILLREMVTYSDMRGVGKVTAKLMETQVSAQNALRKLGFKTGYELKDFVIDTSGKPHTLVIMVDDLADLWKSMEELLMYSDHEQWKTD